jgi:preprotein translocase subunit SecF
MTPQQQQSVEEALKASPPAAIAGLTAFGLSLPDWAALLACIYTAWLIAEKIYLMFSRRRSKRRRKEDE